MNPNTSEMNCEFESMLKSYADGDFARFHMPGHKGQTASPLDVTELSSTDDLTAPENAIKTLEERFAQFYKSKHSFLLVNGSTAGIHAFLLSLGTNKKIIVSRDCHRSIIHGAALCDDELIFISTQTHAEIKNALTVHHAEAVILTSPTYYGECADISAISDICHKNGALLFVDAAHGAHFPFSDMLPYFPYDKVDMWCVSTHKTLNALTQTAVLNLGICSRFSEADVRRKLLLANTSSPSFLLMLSLEKALNHASDRNLWNSHILRIKSFREKLSREFSDISLNNSADTDITRLCINVSATGNTGYAAMRFLEQNGIMAECADAERIVLITTPSDKDEWYDRLFDALKTMKRNSSLPILPTRPQNFGKQKISIRNAIFSSIEYIPIEKSIGRISAACIGLYPPGSAIIAPGEEILPEIVDYLLLQQKLFGNLYGLSNGAVPCVMGSNVI
ncbi:MAG: aminotransferase class V-fold PLP-dependent enzyme [Clostridia bacterium]|nr:aminotransferase class V-fold PLP-dependent enzyme [Clostridia bacterium]